jgi:hypothetical protein
MFIFRFFTASYLSQDTILYQGILKASFLEKHGINTIYLDQVSVALLSVNNLVNQLSQRDQYFLAADNIKPCWNIDFPLEHSKRNFTWVYF